MPLAIAARVARRHRDFYQTAAQRGASAFKTAVTASVRMIAACQDNQVALDGRSKWPVHSAFAGRLGWREVQG